MRTVSIRLPPPLPVISRVPNFQLTDQYGQPHGSDQLRGRVWVANFVFTRCPTICPELTRQMGKVQHRARGLGDAFRLVSFSVDPEHDIDVAPGGGTDPFLLNGLTLGGTNNGSNNTTSTVNIVSSGAGGVLRFTSGTANLNLTATNGAGNRSMTYAVGTPIQFLGDFNLAGSGNATFNFTNVTLPSLWNATMAGTFT